MWPKDHTLLEYALLGLIRLCQPCSGYDLRRMFAAEPMAIFSDSPGSIYPALKRLEDAGMVHCAVDASSELRRRRLYRLSAQGKRALQRWLGAPITVEDVARRLPELSLRFSFLEDSLGPEACRSFLEGLGVALGEYIATLRTHWEENKSKMSRSASLTLQGGIMGYECHAAWVRMALAEYPKSTRR
jgi:DNA-binding PadR family transcriptional regulator